jgi:glycosyltransferase involved in cell wall biosynthesis
VSFPEIAARERLDESVSVIIATNRGGPYLAEAVGSVRAQTHPVGEIILVDDGSPEPGLKSVASTLNVTYLRQSASGVSAARNAGVAASTGRWLAFLDDDDFWHPDRIAMQLAATRAHPDAIASFTGGWHMDAEGRDLGADWGAPDATREEMLSGRIPFPRIVTLLVDRRAFIAVGEFDPGLRFSEDNDLVLRLLMAGEFAGVDAGMVGYRRHPENVTNHIPSGYSISRKMLSRHQREARRRGDHINATLISENLRRFRARVADESVGAAIGALRRHNVLDAARVTGWLALRLPIQAVGAVSRRRSR